MNSIPDNFTLKIPLTLKAHQLAQQFYNKQRNSKKAKQVYLNTLAVLAVNSYLECLGIATDLEAGDSWNTTMQTLSNTADLVVKGRGRLECLPVLPNVEFCEVPLEVLEDRNGYIAVQLNQELTEATLLGFVSEVVSEALPLSQLKSLDELLTHLEGLQKPLNQQNQETHNQETVQLNQWLHNVFNSGWETLERLFKPSQPQLAFNFRNQPSAQQQNNDSDYDVRRGKIFDLERNGEQMALVIGIKPTTSPELDISVEVYPTNEQVYLPSDLELMVLDKEGEAVMQAKARTTESIQLEFSGEAGESFGVKVALGEFSITEEFVI